MTKIKMPRVAWGTCQQCKFELEYNFNEYGATESCWACNAPSVMIKETK